MKLDDDPSFPDDLWAGISPLLPLGSPKPEGGRPRAPDRGEAGAKRHLVVDDEGTLLGRTLSGANRHDSWKLASTLDACPAARGPRGRPRRRPHKLHADRRHDHPRCRHECRARGIVARIARRGIDSSERHWRHRWKTERTPAWLAQSRRLAVRHERRADVHLALATRATAVICIWQVGRALHASQGVHAFASGEKARRAC